MAIPLFSFNVPKWFSIRCRPLQVSLSKVAGNFRLDSGGMTGMMSRSGRSFRNQSASKALSAGRCPAERVRISASVLRRSCACPGTVQKSTGLPSASVSASILVVMPPRERPMAWQRVPLLRPDPSGGPSQSSRQSWRIPGRHPRPTL